jgi:hypothetical protein
MKILDALTFGLYMAESFQDLWALHGVKILDALAYGLYVA